MEIQGSRTLRRGRTRSRYGRVDHAVSARLSEDGTEVLIESSIPVSSGWSDVCIVLPVAQVPELVRIALGERSNDAGR